MIAALRRGATFDVDTQAIGHMREDVGLGVTSLDQCQHIAFVPSAHLHLAAASSFAAMHMDMDLEILAFVDLDIFDEETPQFAAA